jgi:hypothetical protein
VNEMQLRNHLKSAYPNSRRWAGLVDRMPVAQVFAILVKFKLEGKVT